VRRRSRATAVGIVSAATFAVVVAAGGGANADGNGVVPSRTLLRLHATPTGMGANGSRIALVGPHVVVADLASGKTTTIAAGTGNPPAPVAVSASTVLWLDEEGGNEREDTLRVAAPGGRAKRLAQWTVDNVDVPSLGYHLGGLAGTGPRLAYALYVLSAVHRRPGECSGDDPPCRVKVTGGGTFLVTPGSLGVRKVLPPARAVAVDATRVAAAVLQLGAGYSGPAQVVVADLVHGSIRKVGKPAAVRALALAGDRVAAVVGASPARVRVWSVKTGAPVTTLRLAPSCPLVYGAVPRLALTPDSAVFSCARTIVAFDLRGGRRRVIARGWVDFGPWIWRRSVVWAVVHRPGTARGSSIVRAVPLSRGRPR
jgi:hypothetical protein